MQHTQDEPLLVEADPESGFNYPYYLATPPTRTGRRPLLIEPHNVGGRVDEFDRHLELARQRITGGFGRAVADDLGTAMLVPVFPRPFESEAGNWRQMVYMLCAETMAIDEGPLERVDEQLLAMVADARARLVDRGFTVPEEVVMNGFSSQANFVNRFAALHPDRVGSVSAGGINGLAILPETTADLRALGEQPMNYPVGVANVEALTGDPFDREAFCAVDQFLYMGTDDHRDSLLWPDAWTDPKLRGVAVLTYGEDIHDERFPRCKHAYEEAGANGVFRLYDGVGHEPGPALDDVVAFHERSLAGEDIDSIRADLGGPINPEDR